MKTIPDNDLDIIESALDKIETGQQTLDAFLSQIPDRADELRPQLEAALWLRSRKPSLEARPGFLTASQANLMAALRISPPAKQKNGFFQRLFSTSSPRNPLLEVLSLLTLIVCIVFVSHNVLLMSELSLPGEPLYSIKLSLEQSRLAFTFDDQEDARLQIEMSQRRTSEIIELILDEKYQAVPQAADRLDHQLQAALASLQAYEKAEPTGGLALSLQYQETLSTENVILTVLLDTYPPEARQYIKLALQVTARGLAALQD